LKPKFYITTAIPYANARPHLGHSYELIATDVIARYRRLAGFDVWFLTGLDENSQNAERAARDQGIPTQQYVDRIADAFRETWRALDISYDDFVRTTEPRHRAASRTFFQRAYDNGDIYRGTYEGYYCVSCEAYYDEGELLEDANCPVHGSRCDWLSESNYFFALSRYQDRLLQHIEQNPQFIQPPSRRNEVLAFIRRGLKDFSISRESVRWGIPTPLDDAQVIYVWFDALINYLTGVGYPNDDASLQKHWPCDLHVIGKDITRFHCIYWPAMLMSVGLPLPARVFGHGWVTLKGEKMSKSRGIYVDPVRAVAEYGADAIRFFLMRDIPFGQDGDFTWESFVGRYNADLANDLGNLLNRTLSLAARNFDGAVPTPGPPQPADRDLERFAAQCRDEYTAHMDEYALHSGVEQAMALVRAANKYISDTAPWTLARQGERERLATVLYTAMESLRWAAVLLAPVIPASARRIHEQLGTANAAADMASLRWGGLRPATRLGTIEPLFPRIEAKKEEGEDMERVEARTTGAGDTITIQEFAKLDLRAAEVLAAERIPNADKLLKLRIRIGAEERQIVAGVAESYAPEELVGKRIVVVANLPPRRVFGVESRGMLLAAEHGDGYCVAEFARPVEPGAKVS
jgi:methionyl-tRNA synthetase